MLKSRGGARLVCFLFALSLAVTARADEPVRTNIDVMKLVTNEVIAEVLAGFPQNLAVSELILAPYAADAKYDFMAQVFAQTLTERGYKTFTSQKDGIRDAGPERLTLQFQALDFSLRYPKIYRSHLVGGKVVERRAHLKVMAKLLDPKDSSVVWAGEATKNYEDKFSFSQIDEVEVGEFDWVKPPRKNTNWGKMVEPVVVSAIIVGLIYLFFSNQSSN